MVISNVQTFTSIDNLSFFAYGTTSSDEDNGEGEQDESSSDEEEDSGGSDSGGSDSNNDSDSDGSSTEGEQDESSSSGNEEEDSGGSDSSGDTEQDNSNLENTRSEEISEDDVPLNNVMGEICDDQEDNDGDGLIDISDDECNPEETQDLINLGEGQNSCPNGFTANLISGICEPLSKQGQDKDNPQIPILPLSPSLDSPASQIGPGNNADVPGKAQATIKQNLGKLQGGPPEPQPEPVPSPPIFDSPSEPPRSASHLQMSQPGTYDIGKAQATIKQNLGKLQGGPPEPQPEPVPSPPIFDPNTSSQNQPSLQHIQKIVPLNSPHSIPNPSPNTIQPVLPSPTPSSDTSSPTGFSPPTGPTNSPSSTDPNFCLNVFGRQAITGEPTPPQCMPPNSTNPTSSSSANTDVKPATTDVQSNSPNTKSLIPDTSSLSNNKPVLPGFTNDNTPSTTGTPARTSTDSSSPSDNSVVPQSSDSANKQPQIDNSQVTTPLSTSNTNPSTLTSVSPTSPSLSTTTIESSVPVDDGIMLSGKEHTPDQRALKDIVKDLWDKGGHKPLKKEDAETIIELGKGLKEGYPGFRVDEDDLNPVGNHWKPDKVNQPEGQPHIHFPGVKGDDHIPVEPGTKIPFISWENLKEVGAGAIIIFLTYETIKWGGAILSAPATGGLSLGAASVAP